MKSSNRLFRILMSFLLVFGLVMSYAPQAYADSKSNEYTLWFIYNEHDFTVIGYDATSDKGLDSVPSAPDKEGYCCVGYTINDGSEVYYINPEEGQKSIYGYVPTGDTYFYPYWAEAYTVTFKGNGGSFYWDASEYKYHVKKNGYIYDYPTCINEGKVLIGYKLENDDTIYVPGDSEVDNKECICHLQVKEDITFTAVWADACTITFDGNGGIFEEDQEPSINWTAGKGYCMDTYPSFPCRDGYIFKGYKLAGDDTLYSYNLSKYIVNEEVTFTAEWVEAYRIRYYNDDGSYNEELYDATSGLKLGSYGISGPREKEGSVCIGYTINGSTDIYYIHNEGVQKSIFDYIPTGDTNLYPCWADAYKVTFNANGGTFSGEEEYSKNVIKDGYIDSYNNPSLKGKVLIGFKIKNDDTIYTSGSAGYLSDGEKNIFQYQIKEDTTFYAVWGDACTATFDANGGCYNGNSQTKEITTYKGGYISDFPVPTLEGKAFLGYKIENNNTLYVNTNNVEEGAERLRDYQINDDITFTAVWADAYTVTFDGNGGYFDNNSQKTEYNTNVIKGGCTNEYPTPKREGYVFIGYRIGDDNTIFVSNRPDVGEGESRLRDYQINDDITFTAVWVDALTITFDGNGGYYNGGSQTYECTSYEGGRIYEYPIPTLEGKAFRGYMIENDNNIYIHSSPGSRPAEDGEKYLSSYIVDGELTFKAVWTDKCTATFNANGGCYNGNSQTKEITTYKGGYITDFPVPTLEGKVLLGYKIENNNTLYVNRTIYLEEGSEGLRDYQINDDVTFTAVWADACTVTFEIDPSVGYFGRSNSDTGVYKYDVKVGRGEKILNAYLEPTKSYDSVHYYERDYKLKGTEQIYFSGYAGSFSGVDYIYDYVVNGDVTFEIEFAPKYRVTYNGNGGKFAWGPVSKMSESGSTYWYSSRPDPNYSLANPIPVREGYIFDGWKITDSSQLSGAVLESLENFIPTSDVTFDAVWRKTKCSDLGHDLTHHVAKEATCIDGGNSEYWSCDECGKYYSDAAGTVEIAENSWTIHATGHTYGDLIAEKPASCTTAGMEAHYECSSCHNLFVKSGDEYIETTEDDLIIVATGHAMNAYSAVAVTCTTDGNSAYWNCDKCNKYFSDAAGKNEIEPNSWVIKATGHSWKKPVYIWKLNNNEWTCTATLVCANDDSEQIIEKVTAIGSSTTPASCSEKGTTTYTATFTTNDSFVEQTMEKDDIEALGHDWGEPVYTWSDDNKQCTATRICTRNPSHKETETTNARVYTTATCTEAGITTYTATFVNAAFSVQTKEVAVDALDHDLVEHPAVQATCTSAGNIAYWSCSRCGLCYSDSLGNDIIAENSWIIPISKHSLTLHEAKEPTCTQKGNKEYWKCNACNKTFSDAEGTTEITDVNYIISAKGHSKVIDHAIASTTTSTGLTEGSHCSKCGAILKKQEVVPKITENQQQNNQQSENQQQNNDSSSNSDETSVSHYSNEWVDGKWYGSDGSQNYSGVLSWKSNSAGWWVEDSDGWYPVSCWQKIDGDWYYFDASGYMATNEYVDGYWLNSDGTCSNDYYLTWKSDSTGWWVEDKSGWWPSSKWLKINGSWYYFNSSGYMVTNQYVDGYWIGSDGVCK